MSGPTPRRKRSRWWLVGAAVLVAAVTLTAIVGPNGAFCGGIPLKVGGSSYATQADRTAEWAATRAGPYTDKQIDEIAENASYFFIPKFAENYDLEKQFDDVSRIKAAAKAKHRDVKVFMYVSAQYWLDVYDDGWKPWSEQFRKSYLLDDANGVPVPFYGQTGSQSAGSDPVGHVVDLSNPAYRKYIVSITTDWLEQAPLDGVVFDSANPFIGESTVRRANADGESTANQILCGPRSSVDANGNCDRVAAWNDGLADMLQSVTDAYAAQGKEVVYNGVAPSQLRVNRNVALLDNTDGASNEGFCYNPSVTNKTKLAFNSVTDDAALMQQAAQQGKKLFEITNYQSEARSVYGSYCLAGFLMGWQPGSSFFVYHQGYAYGVPSLPVLPEQDLDLGNPASVDYQTQGSVLHRSFDNGFVAVNVGDKPATFTAPRSGSQYAGGKLVGQIGQGGTITLPARSSAFFLDTPSVPAIGSALGVC